MENSILNIIIYVGMQYSHYEIQKTTLEAIENEL